MAERMKFTDRAIAALPPAPQGQRAEYADSETDGLRIRVTASGVKTFSLLRRIRNGPMERVTLGRFPNVYKTEAARTKAAQLNGIIADGANPAELKRAHKGEPTFAELFKEYIDRHAKAKKRTWREDEQKYRDYLEKPLGRKKVSRIAMADLATIHSAITRDGHPTVANRVKDLVSSVFGRAISWGYLDTNPAKGIEDNKEKSRARFLQKGELPRVFSALDAEPNTIFRDYFLLALLTGARRANVRGMKWRDVNLDEAQWLIPITKNGDEQTVPLVPEAVAILDARKAVAASDAVYVFPAARTDSKLGHMSGERKAWLRLVDRDEATQLRQRIAAAGGKMDGKDGEPLADELHRLRNTARRLKVNIDGARLDDLRIHDLRRTLGSWQARTGASMVIIGKSLGHKSQQATAVYARLDEDPVRQAMETATSAMWEAGGMKASAEVTSLAQAKDSKRKTGAR